MANKINELKNWVIEQQNSLPHGTMTESQTTIYCTLQLVRNRIEEILESDQKKKKNNKQSPGDYGC